LILPYFSNKSHSFLPISGEIQADLESGNSDFAKEVEKKLTNGETFEARLARKKREFESSFKEIVQEEYKQVNSFLFAF